MVEKSKPLKVFKDETRLTLYKHGKLKAALRRYLFETEGHVLPRVTPAYAKLHHRLVQDGFADLAKLTEHPTAEITFEDSRLTITIVKVIPRLRLN